MKSAWGLGALCGLLVSAACATGGTTTGKTDAPPSSVTPKSQMRTMVLAMCECATPECITKIRLSVMRLQATDETRSQLPSLGACTRNAWAKSAEMVITSTERLAAEFCACTNKTCGEATAAKLKQLTKQLPDDHERRLSTRLKSRIDAAGKRIDDCGTRLGVSTETSPEVAGMAMYAKKMCRCKGSECASNVHRAVTTWIKQHSIAGWNKGTKKNVERWKKFQRQYGRCFLNSMTASTSTPESTPPTPAKTSTQP